MNRNQKTPFVFIVGSGRSGTTLLKNILDRHQRISAVTEFQFFNLLYSRRKKNNNFSQKETREYARSKLAHLITRADYPAEESDLDAEEIQACIGEASSYRELFYSASGCVAGEGKYDVIVHNTPSDVFFLNLIFQLFPQAKIIHLVRDGREVVASAARRGWGYHSFDQISQWQESIRAYDQFVQKNAKKREQIKEYSYENLVNSPRNVLSDILSFIRVKEHDAFYDFSDFEYSNSSFERGQEGLYHSKNFKDYFTKDEQAQITSLLADDLRKRDYEYSDTQLYPVLQVWNWYRRIKLRFVMWLKKKGYFEYYNLIRKFIKE